MRHYFLSIPTCLAALICDFRRDSLRRYWAGVVGDTLAVVDDLCDKVRCFFFLVVKKAPRRARGSGEGSVSAAGARPLVL